MTNPRWATITKRTLDLFGRWGDSRTMLRGLLDHAVPVIVVDRFRDDDEGSVYGIGARGGGALNTFPSVSFGSGVNDWELLRVTSLSYSATLTPNTVGIHMFTPINPYNPALTVSPAGVRLPALINNRAFTFGTVGAVGGHNPSLPALTGPFVMPFVLGSFPLDFAQPFTLDPPIRVYRDTTLTFQWNADVVGKSVSIFVDILYRERPKVSSST